MNQLSLSTTIEPQPPASDSTATSEVARRFQSDGFLRLAHFVSGTDLLKLQALYDEIITDIIGCAPHELRGGGLAEQHLLERTPPPEYFQRLRQTPFFRSARQLVAQLAGVPATTLRPGWRLFFKLAGYKQTFWHQDAAYRPRPHDSISVWCTLDHATEQSSCLSYLRGSHRTGLHAHHSHHGHLRVTGVDTANAVACPVDAGGATVHHCRTLHYAGPNQTQRIRRALVLIFGNALSFP